MIVHSNEIGSEETKFPWDIESSWMRKASVLGAVRQLLIFFGIPSLLVGGAFACIVLIRDWDLLRWGEIVLLMLALTGILLVGTLMYVFCRKVWGIWQLTGMETRSGNDISFIPNQFTRSLWGKNGIEFVERGLRASGRLTPDYNGEILAAIGLVGVIFAMALLLAWAGFWSLAFVMPSGLPFWPY
jgi:hypothetical protein